MKTSYEQFGAMFRNFLRKNQNKTQSEAWESCRRHIPEQVESGIYTTPKNLFDLLWDFYQTTKK
jgi:hypothetical protein